MIPTVPQVFGAGSTVIQQNDVATEEGLFIPLSAYAQNGFFSGDRQNGQEMFMRLVLKAAEYLNESNRLQDVDSLRVTVNYGDFDAIVDPPGSNNAIRRDVWSLIAYKSVNLGQFDVSDL